MKDLLLSLLFVTGFCVVSAANPSNNIQLNLGTEPELIVSFEKYTPKLAIEFDAAIHQLTGITEIGSCEKLNIIYFSYDSSIYKTPEEAFEAIERVMKRFNPLLKIGSNSQEVERACEQ